MPRPPAPPALVNRVMTVVAGRVPIVALLETLGRATGHTHRIPVSDGSRGDTCQLVAEHGARSDWVRNVAATPLVRVRSRGRWRAGIARVQPVGGVEDALRRLPRSAAAAVRLLGSDPMPVVIQLEATPARPIGPGWLVVDGIVAAPIETTFAFLGDLSNHDWIGARHLDVVAVRRDLEGRGVGAEVVLHGPLRPTTRGTTTIEHRRRPDLLEGVIRLDGVATADIRWELAAMGGGTRVRLATRANDLAALDRAWLAAGGARWLRGQYDAVLVRLARRIADASGAGDDR